MNSSYGGCFIYILLLNARSSLYVNCYFLKTWGKKLKGLTCPRESQGSDLAVCLWIPSSTIQVLKLEVLILIYPIVYNSYVRKERDKILRIARVNPYLSVARKLLPIINIAEFSITIMKLVFILNNHIQVSIMI